MFCTPYIVPAVLLDHWVPPSCCACCIGPLCAPVIGCACFDCGVQVGVPRSIALNLTVPERVTRFNIDRLQKLVANGPRIHPGGQLVVVSVYSCRHDGPHSDFVPSSDTVFAMHCLVACGAVVITTIALCVRGRCRRAVSVCSAVHQVPSSSFGTTTCASTFEL